MVPLADMCNHKNTTQTSWIYDDDLQGFVITAEEDIAKGEQLYINYQNDMSNGHRFISYGFLQRLNKADEVLVKVNINPEDPWFDVKERELDP